MRAAAAFMPDMLSAGRLVSAVSTALLVPLVANLVLAASPPREGQPRIARFAIAAAAGLLAPCLHAVHAWGSLMRVDMLAVAFGLSAALLVADIIIAQVTFVPEKVTYVDRPIPPRPKLVPVAAPLPRGVMLGVGGVF